MPGIVSASTRLPWRSCAATPRSSAARRRRARTPASAAARPAVPATCVVEFVTKRRRWPASRRRLTATAAPAIGSPETCRTPSTSRRMAAMDSESIRSEVAFRFSRSSGPGGQHAQKTSTRVEALFDVEGSSGLTPAERRTSAPSCSARSYGRSPRTSDRSCETVSSQPTGSSSSCGRRRRCRGRAVRRSPRRPRTNAGSKRRRGARRRSAAAAKPSEATYNA